MGLSSTYGFVIDLWICHRPMGLSSTYALSSTLLEPLPLLTLLKKKKQNKTKQKTTKSPARYHGDSRTGVQVPPRAVETAAVKLSESQMPS